MSLIKSLAVAGALLVLCASSASARTILFIGGGFEAGTHTPVLHYRPETVHDLAGPNPRDGRGDTIGGVPALFKQFTLEAGLTDYDVSLELTGSAGGLERWLMPVAAPALKRIQKPWDIVILHGTSALDIAHPGDPAVLLSSSKTIADMFLKQNPNAKLWLWANWGRADMTYSAAGNPWYGKPIQQMGKDVQAAYEQAYKEEPRYAGLIPVGLAFNRAIDTGIADPNPYDDVGASKMNLWAYEGWHASVYGFYLEALMDFGKVTGLDPLVLLGKDKVAEDIGISPAQAKALMQVAHDTLAASK